MSWVAVALRARRQRVLEAWLHAAQSQPYHHARPARAVSDHIPRLVDALIGLLDRSDEPRSAAPRPETDPELVAASRAHAEVRAREGLRPADVVADA